MQVQSWLAARRAAARRRVTLVCAALALCLALAGGWLGWREKALSALPAASAASASEHKALQARLRLKELALAFHLAKVRRNALLPDLLGLRDIEGLCLQGGGQPASDLRGIDEASPCRARWRHAAVTLWDAAFGPDGPPLPERLLIDPWGSPILLNMSEVSCGQFGPWCPPDALRSPGPDGTPNTPDDIVEAVPQHLGPSRLSSSDAAGGER